MIFADSNGELDLDAPNTKGWADTVAFIDTLKGAPVLKQFATEGSTENMAGLLEDLNTVTAPDSDIEEVLLAVEEAALEAEDILIISE